MSKIHFSKFLIALILTALIAGVGLVPNAAAVTGSAINVNCTVDTSTEWEISDESMGGGLYITWDADNFYVGIDKAPLGNNTIYIDTASNGATTASFGGSFQIAANGGYEYSFSNDNQTANVQRWDGTAWTTSGAPTATHCLATGPGNDVEWGIPWDNIGVDSDTSRVTVLIVSQNPFDDSVIAYWPVVAGNSGGASPSFAQGYIFPNPAGTNASGYSPNIGPTALGLSQFSANNAPAILMLVGLLIIMSITGLLIFNRHQRKLD